MNKINWKIDQVDDVDGWVLVSFVDDDTNEIICQQRFKWENDLVLLKLAITKFTKSLFHTHDNPKINKKLPQTVHKMSGIADISLIRKPIVKMQRIKT